MVIRSVLSWEKDNVKADFLRGNVEQMQKYSSKNLMILNFFIVSSTIILFQHFYRTTILVVVHNFYARYFKIIMYTAGQKI